MNELSIVIITYDNYKLKNGTIETLLLSLDAQSDIVFDVIVVDNCSTLVEFKRLERFISKTAFGFSLSLIRNNCNSISKGRNLGVQYAKGDIILFIEPVTAKRARPRSAEISISPTEKRSYSSRSSSASKKQTENPGEKRLSECQSSSERMPIMFIADTMP